MKSKLRSDGDVNTCLRLLIVKRLTKLVAITVFKDDRNFSAFFDPLPPSERKMMSLLLYTMTSLLLIVTAFGRPPPPPRLRSSLKYAP